MWWPERRAVLGILPLAFALSGCLRPLYGPTASGTPVQDSLAAIEVPTVTTPRGQEQLGHYLRSELVFDLNGSGQAAAKRYRLNLSAADSVQVTSTDANTGRADAAFVNVTVTYALLGIEDGRTLTSGTARSTVTYFRDPQRFAAIRAARDAETRAAKQLADDIRQRLAAMFATAP